MSSSSSSSGSDSLDSDYEYTRKRKPSRKKAKQSNLPDHVDTAKEGPTKYECKGCSKVFRTLASRYVHTSKCEAFKKRKQELTCTWCNKAFGSKRALRGHVVEVHGDTSNNSTRDYECHICKTVYKSNIILKYHIRETHFNLIGKAPYAQEKKVNQVWFEKVMNSNNIIEIRKTKDNTLVMKKISENTAIKVNNDNERIIDVTSVYPTARLNLKINCPYCNKAMSRYRYQTHYREVHLNIRDHHCNICMKSFKRNYLLKHHPCYKAQKLKDD